MDTVCAKELDWIALQYAGGVMEGVDGGGTDAARDSQGRDPSVSRCELTSSVLCKGLGHLDVRLC